MKHSTHQLQSRLNVWLTICAGLLWLLAYQWPVTLRLDVGAPGDEAQLTGFYFAEGAGENSFRWSSGQAQVALSGVGSRAWQLRLRASGSHPEGPVPVTVTANGRPVATLQVGAGMSEYALELPSQFSRWDGNLFVGLTTTTFTAPPDTRELGVQVDWLQLSATGWSLTAPPLWMLLVFLAALLCLQQAAGRLVANAVMTSLVGGGLTLAVATLIIVDRLTLAVLAPWALLGGLLLWVLSGWLRQARWWEWLTLAAALFSAYHFGRKALDFFYTGLPQGDFSIYFTAAQQLRNGQPIYDFAAAIQMPNGPVYKYPPLFAMLFAPFAKLDAGTVAAGWYLLNLALLVWSLALIARLPTRPIWLKRSTAFLLLLCLGCNFQPAWESLIRGQLDVLILWSALVSLTWINQQIETDRITSSPLWREWAAGSLLAFVTMLKVYPGLLACYLLWRGRWHALAGFALSFGLLTVLSGWAVGWATLWQYLTVLGVQTAAVPWPENQSLDGFVSRWVIPAAQSEWFTTIPFARPVQALVYGLSIGILLITMWQLWLRPGPAKHSAHFQLGYAATLVVIVLVWPTSWIHYETLLLLPIALVAYGLLATLPHPSPPLGREGIVTGQSSSPLYQGRARVGFVLLLLASILLLAIGNEYTVLIPQLHQDSPWRLLQSYKFYGMIVLWALLLWYGRQKAVIDG